MLFDIGCLASNMWYWRVKSGYFTHHSRLQTRQGVLWSLKCDTKYLTSTQGGCDILTSSKRLTRALFRMIEIISLLSNPPPKKKARNHGGCSFKFLTAWRLLAPFYSSWP